MQGQIIKIVSNHYTVLTPDNDQIECVAMGKLRLGVKPLVGDKVEYEQLEDHYCIQKIYERKNQLYRPAIANVDQAMIVMSAVEPDFSTLLVDKLIFLISYENIEPIIVVTKMDLTKENDQVHHYIQDYQKSGYKVLLSSKDLAIEDLADALANKITVLAGQSGVGKSTLLNKLDPSYSVQTQEISKSRGRGKHTTRHTQLYPINNGWLADTPGFSSLDFSRIDGLTLSRLIPDFKIDQECRFKDCKHVKEPNCQIKQGVESGTISKIRYKHYVDVLNECNQRKEWE